MAKVWNVEIKEILSKTVEIEADSREEAEDKAEQMYYDCDIVLDAGETDIDTLTYRSFTADPTPKDVIKGDNFEYER